MAGNERKENYRRPYRNPRYKGRNENAAETAEEVKIPRRAAHIERTTSETDIQLSIDLDGSGESDIDTGIGFFDHMLKSFAKHGLFDLTLRVKGDLIVDCHHTIEDVGIVLGEAIKQALGDKKSIRRYGDIMLPMEAACHNREYSPTLRTSGVRTDGQSRYARDLRRELPHYIIY